MTSMIDRFTINPAVFTNLANQLGQKPYPIKSHKASPCLWVKPEFLQDAAALAGNVSFGDKDLDQYQVRNEKCGHWC